jgi:hypothetical protein
MHWRREGRPLQERVGGQPIRSDGVAPPQRSQEDMDSAVVGKVGFNLKKPPESDEEGWTVQRYKTTRVVVPAEERKSEGQSKGEKDKHNVSARDGRFSKEIILTITCNNVQPDFDSSKPSRDKEDQSGTSSVGCEERAGTSERQSSVSNQVSVAAATSTAATTATPEANKPKKKKKASKEERKAAREAKAYHELYKPKDSHVNVLTPEMFRKMRGDAGQSKPKVNHIPAEERSSADSTDVSHPSLMSLEFPSLETLAAPRLTKKSFTNTSSYPPPQYNLQSSKRTVDSGNNQIHTPSATASSEIAKDQGMSELKTSETPKSSTGSSVRHSKSPFVISLDDLIVRKEKDNSSSGKQLAKKRNQRSSAVIKENHKLTMGNALDGSGPSIIHRGKIRLKPKKPSRLKKCILKSREFRRTFAALSLAARAQEDLVNDDVSSQSGMKLENCDIASDSGPSAEDSERIGTINTVEVSGCDNMLQLQPVGPQQKLHMGLKDENDVYSKDGFDDGSNKETNVFKDIMNKIEDECKAAVPVPDAVVNVVKLQLHSRKFRNYCDMFVTKEFHMKCVVPMLKELHRLQDRLYKTDPMKFKIKRRFLNGLKDSLGALKLNKAQMIIIAPDIEPNNQQGVFYESTFSSLVRILNVKYWKMLTHYFPEFRGIGRTGLRNHYNFERKKCPLYFLGKSICLGESNYANQISYFSYCYTGQTKCGGTFLLLFSSFVPSSIVFMKMETDFAFV